MSERQRRHFTSEQKAAILKRHLVDKVAVSDLCDEYGLQPSVFTPGSGRRSRIWPTPSNQRSRTARTRRQKELEAKIEQLESKIIRKDEVIAEISEEHIALKKSLGEL